MIICDHHNIWNNPSHWRTHIFQDGYCTTNQVFFTVQVCDLKRNLWHEICYVFTGKLPRIHRIAAIRFNCFHCAGDLFETFGTFGGSHAEVSAHLLFAGAVADFSGLEPHQIWCFFGCPMKIGIYKLFGVFPICGQNSGDTVMMCQNISSTFWALWPILRNIPGESHNQIPHHKWCLRPMTFIVSRCRQLLQRASAITLKKWIEKGWWCAKAASPPRRSRSSCASECWKEKLTVHSV